MIPRVLRVRSVWVLLGMRTSGWRFGVSSEREVTMACFKGDVEIGDESDTFITASCGDCLVDATCCISRLNGDPSLG
jgi:hypothetical protein